MSKTISIRFKNPEHAKIGKMLLEAEREKHGYSMTPELERAEQIKNAEAAYKRGEISAEWLAWYRQFTAKAITYTPPVAAGVERSIVWTQN